MPIRLLKFLTVFTLLLLPAFGQAQELKDLIAGLGEPDPKPAIEALATNDDPKAKAALQALAAGHLFRRLSDSAVIIGEKDSEMYVVTNATTGEIEDMAKPDELEPIEADDTTKTLLASAGATAEKADDVPLDFAGAVKALNAENFAEKGKAIERLTALADGRAVR
ncbi:MAG: hypothetical protein FJX55_20205, partial [Alphaproteobacteria bacterium]|nr:hypothetical protein [Alphaproteobacteria bacterium]